MAINKAAAQAAKRQANMNIAGASLEGLRSVGVGLQSAAKNEAVASWKDTWKQILSVDFGGGSEAKPQAEHGEKDPKNGPVEIFNAKNHKGEGAPKKKEAKKSHQEAAMNHGAEVKKVGEKALQKDTQEKRSEIDQIKSEIDKLAKASTTESQTKFATHTLNHAPKRIGNYDVVFFKDLLKSAQISKEKAADSGSWLSAAKGKNAKRGDFSIANGKMHQSGERTTVQNAAG